MGRFCGALVVDNGDVDGVVTVGAGLGLAPPLCVEKGLWPWLKLAGDGLAPVARRLVMTFSIGLLGRYQCHQPRGP